MKTESLSLVVKSTVNRKNSTENAKKTLQKTSLIILRQIGLAPKWHASRAPPVRHALHLLRTASTTHRASAPPCAVSAHAAPHRPAPHTRYSIYLPLRCPPRRAHLAAKVTAPCAATPASFIVPTPCAVASASPKAPAPPDARYRRLRPHRPTGLVRRRRRHPSFAFNPPAQCKPSRTPRYNA